VTSFASNLERTDQRRRPRPPRWVPPSPDARTATVAGTHPDLGKDRQERVSIARDREVNLISLGKDVASINDKNPQLLELSEHVAALKLQSSAGVREIAAANQLVMLTQRIAKNASALLLGDAIDPEIAFLLGKDTNTFRDTLKGTERKAVMRCA
jgi:twitching motility protein PilJ